MDKDEEDGRYNIKDSYSQSIIDNIDFKMFYWHTFGMFHLGLLLLLHLKSLKVPFHSNLNLKGF